MNLKVEMIKVFYVLDLGVKRINKIKYYVKIIVMYNWNMGFLLVEVGKCRDYIFKWEIKSLFRDMFLWKMIIDGLKEKILLIFVRYFF